MLFWLCGAKVLVVPSVNYLNWILEEWFVVKLLMNDETNDADVVVVDAKKKKVMIADVVVEAVKYRCLSK
jgi:hypothetical protein